MSRVQKPHSRTLKLSLHTPSQHADAIPDTPLATWRSILLSGERTRFFHTYVFHLCNNKTFFLRKGKKKNRASAVCHDRDYGIKTNGQSQSGSSLEDHSTSSEDIINKKFCYLIFHQKASSTSPRNVRAKEDLEELTKKGQRNVG